MRVLISGVTGFVGGHLVEHLATAVPAARLFGLVRPHGAAPGDLPRGVELLAADLDDADSVNAAVAAASPDRVVHLAGQSSVQSSWSDPGATLRTNVLGLVHLMEALRASAPHSRVLVVGSAEEYGVTGIDEPPLRESHPLRPRSPYAVSKAAQGLLALQYAEAGGIDVVLSRTFPHTGPRRGEAFAESSFAHQIAQIEAGRREPRLEVGNLDAVRDFTDVRDVVRAYALLLEKGVSGQVYNVCCGTAVRIRDVLDTLIEISGISVEVALDPHRLRPVDVPSLVGDPSRLRALGWRPSISLRRTLEDLLDYWRSRLAVPPP